MSGIAPHTPTPVELVGVLYSKCEELETLENEATISSAQEILFNSKTGQGEIIKGNWAFRKLQILKKMVFSWNFLNLHSGDQAKAKIDDYVKEAALSFLLGKTHSSSRRAFNVDNVGDIPSRANIMERGKQEISRRLGGDKGLGKLFQKTLDSALGDVAKREHETLVGLLNTLKHLHDTPKSDPKTIERLEKQVSTLSKAIYTPLNAQGTPKTETQLKLWSSLTDSPLFKGLHQAYSKQGYSTPEGRSTLFDSLDRLATAGSTCSQELATRQKAAVKTKLLSGLFKPPGWDKVLEEMTQKIKAKQQAKEEAVEFANEDVENALLDRAFEIFDEPLMETVSSVSKPESPLQIPKKPSLLAPDIDVDSFDEEGIDGFIAEAMPDDLLAAMEELEDLDEAPE